MRVHWAHTELCIEKQNRSLPFSGSQFIVASVAKLPTPSAMPGHFSSSCSQIEHPGRVRKSSSGAAPGGGSSSAKFCASSTCTCTATLHSIASALSNASSSKLLFISIST